MEKNEEKLEPIFSVSEYIEFLNINLKKIGVAKIVGEVTKVTFPSNGHVYFSIKDKSGVGVLDVKIWKNNYALCGVRLEEGMEVILFGCSNVYLPTGRISFIAQTIELKGEGALKKAYEELKNKLEREGLFAEERKKKIPAFPERIGIITSKQGAVLADFLSNIGNYGFKIKMVDSRVEGQSAIADLLSAVKTIKKKDIEVLVIMRGGGSFESLQPFNNELLVREVASSPFPVIAAIGHDKDVPLAALAADYSVSTPSIAATVLSESWEQAATLLEGHKRDIINSYEDLILNKYKEIEIALKISFQTFKNTLQIIRQQLEHSEKIIYLRNPETQLKLGYSIARCGSKLIRSVRDTKIGADVDIRVVDGTIISKIKNINKINEKHA